MIGLLLSALPFAITAAVFAILFYKARGDLKASRANGEKLEAANGELQAKYDQQALVVSELEKSRVSLKTRYETVLQDRDREIKAAEADIANLKDPDAIFDRLSRVFGQARTVPGPASGGEVEPLPPEPTPSP